MILRPGKKKLWLPSSAPFYKAAGAGGGAGSAVLTFVGSVNVIGTAADGTNTFSACPIGTASANRKVLVVIVGPGSYLGAATTVTFNNGSSIPATVSAGVGSGAGVGAYSGSIAFAWADVPTGTTMDVTTDKVAQSGDGALYCAVYTFDKTLTANSSPTTKFTNTAGPGTSQVTTLNTGSGGFLLAPLYIELLAAATSQSITAASEATLVGTSDASPTVHYNFASKKSGTATNSPSSVTWGWTTSAQSLGALLAWN